MGVGRVLGVGRAFIRRMPTSKPRIQQPSVTVVLRRRHKWSVLGNNHRSRIFGVTRSTWSRWSALDLEVASGEFLGLKFLFPLHFVSENVFYGAVYVDLARSMPANVCRKCIHAKHIHATSRIDHPHPHPHPHKNPSPHDPKSCETTIGHIQKRNEKTEATFIFKSRNKRLRWRP